MFKKASGICLFFLFVLIIAIYHSWFDFSKALSSGDWPYLYKENIQEFSLFPQAPFLWLEPYYNLTAKLGAFFSLSWEIIEKVFWFIPFIVISLVGSYLLSYALMFNVKELSYRKTLAALGSLIYISNTYVLMIVGGGQMGVAMAYAFAPLIFYLVFRFANAQSKLDMKNIFLAGIVGGIQLMFDPRIFILTFIGIFLYSFFHKAGFLKISRLAFVAIIAVFINLFWILPNSFSYQDFYNDAATAITIHALSFAQFSNSISLLHPNWPENIFGKVYFMRSEFLVLPILAYISLISVSLMRRGSERRPILFFSILGLIGAFFAKGVNPPFGEIYVYLSNIPGFLIFRDPTKWYLFIAISYSILIPYLFSRLLKGKLLFYFGIIIFLVFWAFTIRPVFFGQLNGTFKPQVLPSEYVRFRDFLNSQSENFSTLWVPRIQRFGFSSASHPAISAEELFNLSTPSALLKEFKNLKSKELVKKAEIKYVVISYDLRGEIFLTDRAYDENKRLEVEKALDSITWLTKMPSIGKLTIYKIKMTDN